MLRSCRGGKRKAGNKGWDLSIDGSYLCSDACGLLCFYFEKHRPTAFSSSDVRPPASISVPRSGIYLSYSFVETLPLSQIRALIVKWLKVELRFSCYWGDLNLEITGLGGSRIPTWYQRSSLCFTSIVKHFQEMLKWTKEQIIKFWGCSGYHQEIWYLIFSEAVLCTGNLVPLLPL